MYKLDTCITLKFDLHSRKLSETNTLADLFYTEEDLTNVTTETIIQEFQDVFNNRIKVHPFLSQVNVKLYIDDHFVHTINEGIVLK